MNPEDLEDIVIDEGGEEPTTDEGGEQSSDENSNDVTVSISTDVETIPEGNDGETTTVTYTVIASEPLDSDARVIIDSTGGNNPLLSEPLDISAGQQSVTFTNEVTGDSIPEEDETLTGTVTFAAFNAPDGSTGEEIAISQPTATVTVTDDDGGDTTPPPPSDVPNIFISADTESVSEGNEGETTPVTFTIGINSPLERDITINAGISTVVGEDPNTTVAESFTTGIPAGEQSVQITTELVGDNIQEPNGTISGQLTNAFFTDNLADALNVTQSIATTTVLDDDDPNRPVLSIVSDLGESAPEGDDGDSTTVSFTLNLTSPLNSDLTVPISASVTRQRAGGNTDAIQVIIPAGETSVSFDVAEVEGDTVFEFDEIYGASIETLDRDDIDIASSRDSVTIFDDDDAGDSNNDGTDTIDSPIISISAERESFSEGNDGDTTPLNFVLSLDAPIDRDILVLSDFSYGGNGRDREFGLGIAGLIPAGEQSVTYAFSNVVGDNIPEEDETLTLRPRDALIGTALEGIGNFNADRIVSISDPSLSATITAKYRTKLENKDRKRV